jgi:hypothetical protein
VSALTLKPAQKLFTIPNLLTAVLPSKSAARRTKCSAKVANTSSQWIYVFRYLDPSSFIKAKINNAGVIGLSEFFYHDIWLYNSTIL